MTLNGQFSFTYWVLPLTQCTETQFALKLVFFTLKQSIWPKVLISNVQPSCKHYRLCDFVYC